MAFLNLFAPKIVRKHVNLYFCWWNIDSLIRYHCRVYFPSKERRIQTALGLDSPLNNLQWYEWDQLGTSSWTSDLGD